MPLEHVTGRPGATRMIQRTRRAPGDGAVRARICRTDGPAGQRAPPESAPGALLGASSGTAYVTAMWPIGRPPQWVGRTQELEILRAAAKSLRGGEGAAVWVEGEPGIGKSSLVAEALASASDPEWEIGWGMADQLTERLPLRVMLDCLQEPRNRSGPPAFRALTFATLAPNTHGNQRPPGKGRPSPLAAVKRKRKEAEANAAADTRFLPDGPVRATLTTLHKQMQVHQQTSDRNLICNRLSHDQLLVTGAPERCVHRVAKVA